MGGVLARGNSADNNLTRCLKAIGPVTKQLHYDIVEEDLLAYERLRLELYRFAQRTPQGLPHAEFALFISMSCEFKNILRAYEELIAMGRPTLYAKKELLKEIITAHYRFKELTGGLSQIATHAVLHNVDFCLSVVVTGEEAKSQRDKAMRRFHVTAGLIRPILQSEEEDYFPTKEIRLDEGKFSVIKADGMLGHRTHNGNCELYKQWKSCALSLQAAVYGDKEVSVRERVGLIMSVEGD